SRPSTSCAEAGYEALNWPTELQKPDGPPATHQDSPRTAELVNTAPGSPDNCIHTESLVRATFQPAEYDELRSISGERDLASGGIVPACVWIWNTAVSYALPG